jgi:molecular chaperone DnaJ
MRGFLSIRMPCGACRGAGQTIASPCPACRGAGRVPREETLEIKIPAGVEDGTRLRLVGQGEAGANGAPPGDLYVVVRVKEDPFFERRGDDVFCQVPIQFSQAALGAEIEVPALAGRASRMKIPPGTQPNQVFRLRGMGFPSVHGYGRGDQLVEIVVEVPKKLTAEQERLLAEFSKTETKNIGPMQKSFLDRLKRYFKE